MSTDWTTHFDGTVEDRPVKAESYFEGDYFRVHTTLGADYAGNVYSDESSTTIIPPVVKGAAITLEGESLESIRQQLLSEGFSAEAIDEIISHFPRNDS